MEHEAQNRGMETGHKDETDNTGNETGELNFFVVIEAASKVVGDLFMKAGDKNTGDHDDNASNTPTKLKFPIHKLIVLYLHCILQK